MTHLKWTAPEFNYYPKNKSWFVVLGLITIALLLWAVFTKNFIFALLIILGYFSFIAFSLKKPNQINVAVEPKGIKVDNILYDFDNLKSFWIFYELPEIREISLRSKKMMMPYIKIPLGEQNPVEVREILMKYIPERKQKESLIDNLSRNLRF